MGSISGSKTALGRGSCLNNLSGEVAEARSQTSLFLSVVCTAELGSLICSYLDDESVARLMRVNHAMFVVFMSDMKIRMTHYLRSDLAEEHKLFPSKGYFVCNDVRTIPPGGRMVVFEDDLRSTRLLNVRVVCLCTHHCFKGYGRECPRSCE